MKKLYKNESGFSAVEVLLVILILVVIGAVGYMVYHNDHKASTASATSTASKSSSPTSSTKTSSTQTSDPTANWATYTSSSGGFSLKYPKSWVTTANSTDCPTGLLMLGANDNSIGQCGTNNFGQMTVTWQPVKAQCGLNDSDWTINSTQNVTVSGVSGLETNATSKTATTSGLAGTSTIQYCFITKGNMYVADYTELSSYPNVLSDFRTMVTKTLSLN
jgi:hypothetical protein